MSSASRNDLLEAILAAKFDLEHCEDEDKAACSRVFESRLSEVLRLHPTISRGDLIEAIAFKYREYKAARIKAQRRRETL